MTLSFDPRAQVLVLASTSVLLFGLSVPGVVPVLVGLLLAYLAVQGMGRVGLVHGAVFLVLVGLSTGLQAAGLRGAFSFDFVLFLFSRLIPLSMAGAPLFALPSSRVLWLFEKARLPRALGLAAAIALRFGPTVATEARAVTDAMKVRGLWTLRALVLRPLATLEYTLVPLVIRCLRVADELAAAAAVRGVENPQPRTYAWPPRWRTPDTVVALVGLALVGAGPVAGGWLRWS